MVFRKRKTVPVIEAAAPGSLAEALAAVPDPRRPYGWRPEHEPIPLVALLQQTVVALLCGARGQSAVAPPRRSSLEALELEPVAVVGVHAHAALRELDAAGVDEILARVNPTTEGLGDAIGDQRFTFGGAEYRPHLP